MVHHRAARWPAWIHLPRVSPAAQSNSRCRAADRNCDYSPYSHGHLHSLANAIAYNICAASYPDDYGHTNADANPNPNGHADAASNPNGHTNTNADPDPNSHGHGHADAASNPNGHTNTNADLNSHGHSHTNADPNSHGHTNTNADLNSNSNGHADANSNDDPNAHRDANDHANRDVIVVSYGPNADANALSHGVSVAR